MPTSNQGNKLSYTRAYYSPDTQAYELGYKGGYGTSSSGYIKNVFITMVSGASVFRTTFLLKLVTVLSNNISVVGKRVSRVKSSSIISIPLSRVSRATSYIRKSSVLAVNIAESSRIISLIKRSQAIAIPLSKVSRTIAYTRKSFVLQVQIAKSSKYINRVKMVFAKQVQLARSSKTISYIRRSTVTAVKIARVTKIAAISKFVKVINVARGYDGKITLAIKFVTVTAIKAAKSTRIATHVRTSKALAVPKGQPKRTVNLLKITRALSVKIGKSLRIVSLHKLGKALRTPIAFVTKRRVSTHKVVVLQSAAATVTRQKVVNRSSSVTATYIIGTSKNRTYVRQAIATAVLAAKYAVAQIFNIRITADEVNVEPIAQTPNYVLPETNLEPIPGDGTDIFDDVPFDYNEEDDGLGDAIIPDPNYNN